MAKKAYIGVGNFVPRALPAGYTQAEYIQSSGTQYIDTGFMHNQDTRVVMDVQPTSVSDNAWAFGGRITNSSAKHDVFYYYTSNSSWTSDYDSSRKYHNGVGATDRVLIDFDKNVCSVNGVTDTHTSTTFQSTTNLILLALSTAGTISGQMSAKLYSCQIYDNGTLIRDYVPCTNSAGVAGLYDMANGVFYQNAGTGSFAVGTSIITSVARKIVGGYIGVDGIAREIKKAYIGIGGVARPCWSGGELAYYGRITDLSKARDRLAATTVGSYALFGGGAGSSAVSNVDAYSSSLVQSSATKLTKAVRMPAATTVGGYALFGGGHATTYAAAVYSYDSSLTLGTPEQLSASRVGLAATTVGNYALFGGGSGTGYSKDVDTYNVSLTKSTATALGSARGYLAATTVGNYAVFGGGYTGSYSSVVDAYNASLTKKSSVSALSSSRDHLSATAVGNYALFAGGFYSSTGNRNTVDAYNASLTRSTATTLGTARGYMAATTLGNYAIFSGGSRISDNTAYNAVDVYDESLTKISGMALGVKRSWLAATCVGDYALFAGGNDESTEDYETAAVEAFALV